MKATGIVRKIDENGRFVVPMELRRTMNLNTGDDALEIFTDGESIVLRKYSPSCAFCQALDDIIVYKDIKVCRKCAEKLAELAK